MENSMNELEKLNEESRNDFMYAHEVFDRIAVMLNNLDENVSSHPFVTAIPELEAAVLNVESALADAYSLTGKYWHALREKQGSQTFAKSITSPTEVLTDELANIVPGLQEAISKLVNAEVTRVTERITTNLIDK
jgi:hypothetical protein